MKYRTSKNIAIILFLLVILSAALLIYLAMFPDEKNNEENFSNFEIVAEGLDIPWEIEFLPNEEMLVTERPGNLVRIGQDKKIIKVEGVNHIGEGGLLGLALHPNFEQNKLIYLYLTSNIDGKIENRIERYRLNLEKNSLENKEIILSRIPGASYHDGGRIKFGPNRYLYATTGDAGNPENAQDINSLAGKILRIDENGNIPEDNPFNNEIYSYGHRNSQGLAWDEKGNLWATEHGRSDFDELNFIEKGENYGWPEIQGDESKESMKTPIVHSGSSETWAPSSAVFFQGNIFFSGLRGESLYQYNIKEKTLKKHFENQFGRLRAVTIHNNFLYVSTSNRDGRGSINEGDDKIIKIELKYLQ